MFRLKISFNKKRLTVLLSTKSESSYAPGCYRLEDRWGIEKKHILKYKAEREFSSQFV